jgi:anti-anti-sigma regulatory factor
MLKIQVRELEDRIVLEVEGRLTGAFVREVQSAWSTASAKMPGCKVQVDLKSVTCVDREGRALLRSMHSEGVEFLRAGLATQDILDEILQEQGCGDR